MWYFFTRAGANGDPAGLRAVRDLREKADGREELQHRLGLEVVVVDAVEHDVDDVHQEVHQISAIVLDQQLNLLTTIQNKQTSETKFQDILSIRRIWLF